MKSFLSASEDVAAYVDYAEQQGYKRIILAGHSLGANKVIYYLSQTHDSRVAKFILLSPANIEHLTSTVSATERQLVHQLVETGYGQKLLPFAMFGWLPCQAATAWDWLESGLLNNVHVESDKDYSQVESITHTGALLIGSYDRFTYGEPNQFLETINSHFSNSEDNQLIIIEKTGHTYQQKEQELADRLLDLIQSWEV